MQMLLDLLASISISIALQPQNLNKALVLWPQVRYALAMSVCLLRIYKIWRTPDHGHRNLEGLAVLKQQSNVRGNSQARSFVMVCVPTGQRNVYVISPNSNTTAMTPTVAISRIHGENTKFQILFARAGLTSVGNISVLPSTSVDDSNRTPSDNPQPPTCSSGLVQSTQPLVSISPGVSSTSVAKDIRVKCTKSSEDVNMVHHTLVDPCPDTNDAAVSPLTQVSSVLHAKDSSTPVLLVPMLADPCPPRLFSGSLDSTSATISASGSPTSTADIPTAPIASIRNIDAHVQQHPGFFLPCPPKDITRLESAVATFRAVPDIDVLEVGDPLVDMKTLEEQELIVANDGIDATIQTSSNTEGILMSTLTPLGLVAAPSVLSKSKQGSSALSNFKRESAPISLGSDSMSSACPSVKLADQLSPVPIQVSTTKRTRNAPRSTLYRGLQAIRDASVTLSDDSQGRDALDKPTSKQNEAGSTLDNQGIARVTAAIALVPPVSFRARPTGPRPLTVAKVENCATSSPITFPAQPITTPSASDAKARNPTSISNPAKVPCVVFDRSTVKSSEGVILPHTSILSDSTPSVGSSIVMSINRDQASSTTSRMKDANPVIKPSTHSRKARAALRRATSIPVANNNNLTSPVASSLRSAQHASDIISGVVHKSVQSPVVIPSGSNNMVMPMSLEGMTSVPASTGHTSMVQEDSAPPMWTVVKPNTHDAMIVDEPVPPCSSASQINTLPITSTCDLDTTSIFPVSLSHTILSPPSENPASVTSPVAALPSLIKHHTPTMPSFTFGIDNCLQSAAAYNFDCGVSLPVQQSRDLEWPCHFPQVTSPSALWNTIDGVSCAPEFNPWQNVRSFAPSLFYATPSPLPAVGTVESQSIPSTAISKVGQWPHSMLTPQPPLADSCAPAAASMEPHSQAPFADEAEMMVIDDPKPVEEHQDNPLGLLAVVVKEVQTTSASETRSTGVIPWKAPSLRKRVHFETMDNDNTQPSGSRWQRDDSSQNFQHSGEQRETKRLKCATCLDSKSDTHDSLPFRIMKRDGENGRRTVKKRASKADLAEDWRFRQKPVLLRSNLSDTYTL